MAASHPTGYQRALSSLAVNTQRAVMQSYDSLIAAGLSRTEAAEVLTPLIQSSNIEAKAMADAELSRMLARIEGGSELDYAAGTIDPGGSDQIRQALDTALDAAQQDVRVKLQRLAAAQPTESAQYQMSQSMRNSRNVAGYVRVLESDACELCEWLYRDGYVYPPQRPLTTHPGCVCTARPVTPAELVREAENRYGGSGGAAGGSSRSAADKSSRQQTLWRERAESAAAGGDPNWSGPDKEQGIRWSAAADDITD